MRNFNIEFSINEVMGLITLVDEYGTQSYHQTAREALQHAIDNIGMEPAKAVKQVIEAEAEAKASKVKVNVKGSKQNAFSDHDVMAVLEAYIKDNKMTYETASAAAGVKVSEQVARSVLKGRQRPHLQGQIQALIASTPDYMDGNARKGIQGKSPCQKHSITDEQAQDIIMLYCSDNEQTAKSVKASMDAIGIKVALATIGNILRCEHGWEHLKEFRDTYIKEHCPDYVSPMSRGKGKNAKMPALDDKKACKVFMMLATTSFTQQYIADSVGVSPLLISQMNCKKAKAYEHLYPYFDQCMAEADSKITILRKEEIEAMNAEKQAKTEVKAKGPSTAPIIKPTDENGVDISQLPSNKELNLKEEPLVKPEPASEPIIMRGELQQNPLLHSLGIDWFQAARNGSIKQYLTDWIEGQDKFGNLSVIGMTLLIEEFCHEFQANPRRADYEANGKFYEGPQVVKRLAYDLWDAFVLNARSTDERQYGQDYVFHMVGYLGKALDMSNADVQQHLNYVKVQSVASVNAVGGFVLKFKGFDPLWQARPCIRDNKVGHEAPKAKPKATAVPTLDDILLDEPVDMTKVPMGTLANRVA